VLKRKKHPTLSIVSAKSWSFCIPGKILDFFKCGYGVVLQLSLSVRASSFASFSFSSMACATCLPHLLLHPLDKIARHRRHRARRLLLSAHRPHLYLLERRRIPQHCRRASLKFQNSLTTQYSAITTGAPRPSSTFGRLRRYTR